MGDRIERLAEESRAADQRRSDRIDALGLRIDAPGFRPSANSSQSRSFNPGCSRLGFPAGRIRPNVADSTKSSGKLKFADVSRMSDLSVLYTIA